MGYILLALSALALAAAGYLWRADAQEKSGAGESGAATGAGSSRGAAAVSDASVTGGDGSGESRESEEAVAADIEPLPAREPQPERVPLPETEPEEQPGPAAEAVPREAVEAAEEPATTAGATKLDEPEQTKEAAQTEEAAETDEPARTETTAETVETEEAEELEKRDPHNDGQRDQQPKEKTHSRWGALSGAISGALPGAKQRGRKERREWAEANGFEYSREDEFLQDEWGRGAASIGAPVRDVLTGTRFGHETRIADIGETTVVAMGTGMDSGVVVDVRRKANADDATEDLVAVAELEGFRVFASEAGPAERMLDIRVSTALEMLPPQVSAVWFETEWVLAQLDGTPGAQEWEPVFAPLALLADAARTLPPRTWPHLHFDVKTREMGDPVEAPASAKGEGNEHTRPVVARPEEPLELPTRTTGAVRGTMEYRTVGGDEVDAIATGAPPEQLNDGTRLTRRPQPPSIFGDGNADYPG
ncbi:hypothetical protein [Corynebacterium urinipleomorphum]|uniref:hypothetical protein n=1 Tax=Corynebacterium urinipleomorphum TaxID=1852380 RepID=UPI000B351757|nr:hypothetical protein [Corynebacterium urinipleomorphum]